MVETELTLKELAIQNLSAETGRPLEITANLTSPAQIGLVMETFAHAQLGSKYVIQRMELLLRMTKAVGGRHRTDVVELSKGPELVEK